MKKYKGICLKPKLIIHSDYSTFEFRLDERETNKKLTAAILLKDEEFFSFMRGFYSLFDTCYSEWFEEEEYEVEITCGDEFVITRLDTNKSFRWPNNKNSENKKLLSDYFS